jgi:hypothetical protein
LMAGLILSLSPRGTIGLEWYSTSPEAEPEERPSHT